MACITVSTAGPDPQLAEPLRLHAAKRYEESLSALMLAFREGEWSARAYKLKGLNLGALGRGLEAEEALVKAAALAPQDADAWYLLGFARVRTFQYREAVAPLTNAVKLNPDMADAWMALGVAHEWLQRPDEAEQAYRRMLSSSRISNADKARARMAIGKLLVYHQRYQDALEPLNTALRDLPDSAETMKYLARAYRGVGREKDALPVLRRAVELSPTDIEIRYLLLRTCQALGLEPEAQAQIAAIESLNASGKKP